MIGGSSTCKDSLPLRNLAPRTAHRPILARGTASGLPSAAINGEYYAEAPTFPKPTSVRSAGCVAPNNFRVAHSPRTIAEGIGSSRTPESKDRHLWWWS
jgi:hypothetical protein